MTRGLESLRRRIAASPIDPGVYRWLDAKGSVLYIGKAKNLRNRLRSYVSGAAPASPWKRALVDRIADYDVTVTNSELEALILETNLIKEEKPKYNVLMKDDKNYVYVEVTVGDAYPRVDIVRKTADKKTKYFGPYLSSRDTRHVLDILHLILGYRACKESIDRLNRAAVKGGPEPSAGIRPCLDFQIGQCCGLCAGAVTREEYRRHIDALVAFFRGDRKLVITEAQEQMRRAAAEKKFEKAARLRDALHVIEGMEEKQIVADPSAQDADFIGVAVLSGRAHVVILLQRGGKLIAELPFQLMGQAENRAEVLAQVLPQYYEQTPDVPPLLVLPEEIDGQDALAAWLAGLRGGSVRIVVPERGKKSHLLQLAEDNARGKAEQLETKWEAEERNVADALGALQSAIGLPSVPNRIEGYDISHLGGTETVGSMVVILKGKPANDHYRSFTIRTMKEGEIDDYRSLKEVLRRRLKYLVWDLKREERLWKEQGIVIGKARKAEQKFVEDILEKEPLASTDVHTKHFLVGRKGKTIVVFARLYPHPGAVLELKSLWVDDVLRGAKLGHFLIRKILASAKKGKIYVTIDSHLEEYYAELGFRHLLEPPKVLHESMKVCHKKNPKIPAVIAMVYDVTQHKPDASLLATPDLLVIDGGKGQLGVAVEVLRDLGLTIPAIGLAKEREEIFVPGSSKPLALADDSPAKFLLMRLRDEAHRFANRHREKRVWKKLLE